MDTIFALASARGKAGVAVVRISGPSAFAAGVKMVGDLPEPRKTALRILRDAAGERLDEGLVICFPAGHSFTGEEVVEFQIHGSSAAIAAVLRVLGEMPDLRLAEAGEFTRRALENGRLDLAQIEGLADLIDAETEAQRKQALRVFSGALGRRAETWRSQLIRAAALLEATIDFADEDVPVDVTPEVQALIGAVAADLTAEVEATRTAERIRDGFEVAIIGAPNVGKSTLLNALAGREAAITSEIAGTTRDVIEVRMDLRGLPVTVLDTAGLRVSEDAVEVIGIRRAKERAEQADLRVFLIEDGALPADLAVQDGDLVVQAKADLYPGMGLPVSGKTGAGVSDLVDRISDTLAARVSGAGIATRERHRTAMLRASAYLESAQNQIDSGQDRSELAAEELHMAIRALDSLVGRVDVEDLLDEIFSSFCIGK
ncbi:MAG: tRNA uridine-5-carboxymethylaminomethyl(34) synthesis GTPase MnmE [Paracoccaceae bacterium]